jgi:hypothetical protein
MFLGRFKSTSQILPRRPGASYCCVTINRYFMHAWISRTWFRPTTSSNLQDSKKPHDVVVGVRRHAANRVYNNVKS